MPMDAKHNEPLYMRLLLMALAITILFDLVFTKKDREVLWYTEHYSSSVTETHTYYHITPILKYLH